MFLLFGLLIFWFLCALAADLIAAGKGRSGCAFFILGFLFGPFGLLAAAIMPPNDEVLTARAVRRGDLRRCPYCAEAIKWEASVCRHCSNPVPHVEDTGGIVSAVLGKLLGK